MEGEDDLETSFLEQARYWQKIYQELLTMEEGALERIRELMARQSEAARREVEMSDVPVVMAEVARFRERLQYWEDRSRQLQNESRNFSGLPPSQGR